MSSAIQQPKFQFQEGVYDLDQWPDELNDLIRLIKKILKEQCPSTLRLSYLDCDEDEIDIISQDDFEMFCQIQDSLLYVEEGGLIELPLTPPSDEQDRNPEIQELYGDKEGPKENENEQEQNYFFSNPDQPHDQFEENQEEIHSDPPQSDQNSIQDLVQKEVQRQMAVLMQSINQSVYQQVRQDVDVLFTEKTEILAQSIRQVQPEKIVEVQGNLKKPKSEKQQTIKTLLKKEIKVLDQIQNKIQQSTSPQETESAVQQFWLTWKTMKKGLHTHIDNLVQQIQIPKLKEKEKKQKKEKEVAYKDKKEFKKGKELSSKVYRQEIKQKAQEMVKVVGGEEENLYEFVEAHLKSNVQELLEAYFEK